LTIFIWRYQLHAEAFGLLLTNIVPRALKGASGGLRTVI
jgi:hypothetical protein